MLIKNCKLVTWESPNRILEDHALYVEKGVIKEIGSQPTMMEKYAQETQIDARHQYVMPGNICAHTHFYGAFARGLGIPGSPAKDFPEILKKLWWALDKSLALEDVKYSALVCILDAIKHGTTTLVDHHASPNAIAGSLDTIAQVVEQSGIRASLCYEVTDRDGEEKAMAGIRENTRFIEWVQREKPLEGRLSAMFGLHASLTLSEKTLEECRKSVPDNVGFHIHVAEHHADEYDSIEKSGMRVVDRLYRHGILGPRSIAVHCVHVDAKEIALLAETNTWVTHQPRSNMNNAVGLPEVEAMLRYGVKVCLGNDGFSNAMWEEWKAAYLAHKLKNLDPRRMSGIDIVQMAIYNNSELMQVLFAGKQIGKITVGSQADLIFVDYHPFTTLTPDNLPWHILFGFHESMVTTTIVAGNILMRDRQLLTLDEEKIAFEARKLSQETWGRFRKNF
ncbi:MAG: putative aminohydrolase SsnA [Anaerolineae bacterium]|nr:putative aminohydrolase SsnA [Anaerolineae bacterium]